MGLSFFSRSSTCAADSPKSPTVYSQAAPEKAPLPNPNKYRWTLERFERFPNNWCLVVIRYHDCINYNGVKVMVYDNADRFLAIRDEGAIDPHFDENAVSPVARFEPTARGINVAREFACASLKMP